MIQEPFIICDNLVKIYKVGDLEAVALQGLDLIVASGELLGIVGASGSGKSTLMNILGGLDRPSAGRLWMKGNDLLKMSEAGLNRYRRSEVGFVWQQSTRNLIPYLTALENVKLPMTLSGLGGGGKRRRAEELLEVVGLGKRLRHRPSEMSGGEQQRVAIAVALANGPSLLLADEPTGEVDETAAAVIYRAFRDLNAEYALTTLIVSHDPSLSSHVDRVVAIRDGKTSTETVRQTAVPADKAREAPEGDMEEGVVFEELTVLDSAGRLQVPKELLEHFGIRGRVRLELTVEGILIRPVPESDNHLSAEKLADELVESRKGSGLFGALVRRWENLRKRKGN